MTETKAKSKSKPAPAEENPIVAAALEVLGLERVPRSLYSLRYKVGPEPDDHEAMRQWTLHHQQAYEFLRQVVKERNQPKRKPQRQPERLAA